MKRAISTNDKSWLFEYDLRFNFSKAQKSKNDQGENQMLDLVGIVYKEFVPQDQTVNQHFYQEVLEKLLKQ